MKDIVLPAWRSLYNYLHVSGLGGNEAINCRGRGNILVERSHLDDQSQRRWGADISVQQTLDLSKERRRYFGRLVTKPGSPYTAFLPSLLPRAGLSLRLHAQHNLPNSTFAITKIFSLEKLLIQHGHSTLINFFHPASTISLSCISLAGILSLHIQSTGKNRLPSRRIRLPSRLEKNHKTPNWRSPQPRLAPPSSRLYP